MRKLSFAACLAAACAGGAARTDTAATRDTATASSRGSAASTPAPVVAPSRPETTSSAAGSAQSPPAAAPAGPKTRSRPVSGPVAVPSTLVPAESLRAAPPSDSVRGVVSVVGTSFEKKVMVAERGTARRIEVTGEQAPLVGRLTGAEVTVIGALSGSRIGAARFFVRSVDGQPAIDGILKIENGAMYIVAETGSRTRIAAPPASFTGRDGARVWITGDPARAVQAFGFIDPPR